MKKLSIISIGLIISSTVIVFFMDDITKFIVDRPKKILTVKETKDELYSEFNRTTNNLDLIESDFLEGFWYYKNNELAFFDINFFLKQGYSLEEIKKMIKALKGSKVIKRGNAKILSNDEINDDLKFHNSIYKSSSLLDGNYKEIRDELEKKRNKNAIDYYRLSEIYSFQGEYKKSNKFLLIACKKDKKYCRRNKVKVSGTVTDGKKAIKDVKVTLLSSNDSILTDSSGKYELFLDLVKLKKERLSFEKEGLSTTFLAITNNSNNQKWIHNNNIVMMEGVKSYVLNNKDKTVNNDGILKDNYFILKTNKSIYKIPVNSFINASGERYYGNIKAYLFEFNNDNAPMSLLSLDSFSSDRNFLGTSMISYGMPYIIFRDGDGNRVDIKKENPMILETKLDYIEDIFKGVRMSEDKKKEVIKMSSLGKYYYNLEKIRGDYINLIPFWVLDQKTGIWWNTGFDIIDKDKGILKTIFYTTL